MANRFISVLGIISIVSVTAAAQNAPVYTEKDYVLKPVWIQMIKDSTTNYFEAEKAFKIYFEHHAMPEGEHDVIGEHEEHEKHPSKKERRQALADDKMRMEVKKYQRWHDRMLPYVQADGSILTPTQRLQIWQQQKANK